MQLGWIDFSKEDKSNALNIINSLNEPGVLDELGFGILRNAFANDFFPGTSTLHTRAKYLYLVSYMLYDFQKQCAEGRFPATGNAASFINELRGKIDKEELKTKNLLVEKGDLDGVFGSSSSDKNYWVERTPLISYWSALRMFGFLENQSISSNFTYSELLADFYRIAQMKANSKNASTNSESSDTNDSDAGGSVFYPISKQFYNPKWRETIQINLTKKESIDLTKRIINSPGSEKSLFALILKENLLPNAKVNMDFKGFTETIKKKVSDDLRLKFEMANSLNDFYYMTMLRYNYLLCNGQTEKLNIVKRWKEMERNIVSYCNAFDPEKVMIFMNVKNSKLKDFLSTLKVYFLEAVRTGDYSKVDEWIKTRESKLKTTRAKIGHPEKYDVNNLIDFERFDYRFNTAKRHLIDIQEGLKNA